MTELDDCREVKELYESYGHYLYYETAAGRAMFVAVDTDLEPHYLRTVLSAVLGQPDRADWSSYDGRNLLEVGYARLMQTARLARRALDWPDIRPGGDDARGCFEWALD